MLVSKRAKLVRIDPEIYRRVESSLLNLVQRSNEPIAIATALEALQQVDDQIPRELAVALIWQLLATERLRFNESRELLIGAAEHAQLTHAF